MIAHLKGTLLSKTPNQAVVECGGVGYDVAISVQCFTRLPDEGQTASLHVNTQVREDAIALFGFLERQEKQLFEKLITISGVGPKLAMTLLSGIEAAALALAIRSADHALLVRIPGIGKKTAERIVLELKDKLDFIGHPEAPAQSAVPAGAAVEDVISALTNLGYSRPLAQKAVDHAIAANETTVLTVRNDFEQLFRLSMRHLR